MPRRAATALVVGAVLVPVVVSLVAIVGREWRPSGDVALELLQVDAVGGGRTPLTGAWSRWGWDHPGPLLFWLLAPFSWIVGTHGALIGTLAINAAALVGAVLVARRHGGRSLATLIALGALLLCLARGPESLLDPWNPQVPVLVFLLFLLLAWALSVGDVVLAPFLVAAGTLCVQAHVSYLVLTVGVAVVATVLAWSARRPGATATATATATAAATRSSPVRRSVLISVAVGVVLWLPPVLQQLFGADGNLAALVRHARDPAEPTAGWSRAIGVLGAELGLPGVWITRGDDGPFGVPSRSALPALVLLAVMTVLGIAAARRGTPAAARLAFVVLTAAVCGVASTAGVSGPVFDYVVQWWWVIVAMVWVSLAWSAWTLLTSATARAIAAVAACGATVVLLIVVVWRAVPARLPEQIASETIEALGPHVAAGLRSDDAYLLEWIDGFGGTGMGLLFDLDQRGFDVAVPTTYGPAFETWQTTTPEQVDATLLLVSDDQAAGTFEPPSGATVLARHDPLSPADRQRATGLQAEVDEQLAAATAATGAATEAELLRAYESVDEDVLDELAELRAGGSAYTVYLLPATV